MSLIRDAQRQILTATAQCLLARYELTDARIRLHSDLNGAIFRVQDASLVRLGGNKAANGAVLRMYPPDIQDVAVVEAEVQWLQALNRETTLLVPEPMPARDGSIIQQIYSASLQQWFYCTLVSWLPGRFFDRGLTPRMFRQVGTVVGDLHRHAAQWARIAAPASNRQALVIDQSIWEDLIRTPAPFLPRQAAEIMRRAAQRATCEIEAVGKSSDLYGFVHADLHQWNYVFHRGLVGVFDFSDCGWGHYVYDLATALIWLKYPIVGNFDHSTQYRALEDAFLAGYQERWSLPDALQPLLTTYFAARLVMIAAWLVRTKPRSFRVSWTATYWRQATALLRAYLEK